MSSSPPFRLTTLSDEQLVEQYRDGRESAFTELVSRYQQELFHFLVRFTGDRAAAEDVFQESFLQVHTSIDSFETDRRFKPWLFTIAANKARDLIRRNTRRSAVLMSEPLDGSGNDTLQVVDLMAADLPMPGELVQTRETRARVQAVVHSLPDHLREILLLSYFHQFPYKDIAQMLGIPLGTVKSRLHAAVAAFAQLWKQQNGEPEADGDV